MISGLIGFIFRAIILNPMALIGIAFGCFIMKNYGLNNITALLKIPTVYIALFGVALLYSLLFKHVYKEDSDKIDWTATFLGSFNQLFNIILATVFTCAIIFSIDYGFPEKLDSYLRHEKTQEVSEENAPINQSSY